MQVLFFAEKNLDKIKDILGIGGNALGKQTYVIRDGHLIDGSSVTYLAISGSTDAMNLANDQLKDLATEVSDPARTGIINKINEQNAKEKGTKLPPTSRVFSIEDNDLEKVRDIVGIGANSLEKQSVIVRSADALGIEKKGNYILIEGSDIAIELAKKLLGNNVIEVTGEEQMNIVGKIKAEEETAGEGFGSIFG